MKYMQILTGNDPTDKVMADIPEHLELRPHATTENDEGQPESVLMDSTDNTPNRLSPIPEESEQASEYLVGGTDLTGDPPDQLLTDEEMWP